MPPGPHLPRRPDVMRRYWLMCATKDDNIASKSFTLWNLSLSLPEQAGCV